MIDHKSTIISQRFQKRRVCDGRVLTNASTIDRTNGQIPSSIPKPQKSNDCVARRLRCITETGTTTFLKKRNEICHVREVIACTTDSDDYWCDANLAA